MLHVLWKDVTEIWNDWIAQLSDAQDFQRQGGFVKHRFGSGICSVKTDHPLNLRHTYSSESSHNEQLGMKKQ